MRPTRLTRSRRGRRLTSVLATALAATLLGGLAAAVTASPAAAVPAQGSTPWSVLLCKFSDVPTEQHNAAWFGRLLGPSGVGYNTAADWFARQSQGRMNLNGTVVKGWYTMGITEAQGRMLNRANKIQHCIDTVYEGGYAVPAGNRVAVVINAAMDSGSNGGRVLIDPNAWNPRFLVHEMLHSYGLSDSWSNDPVYRVRADYDPGVYDDRWDEMSAANTFSVDLGAYGRSAVGLNAPHLNELGWLPNGSVSSLAFAGSYSLNLNPIGKGYTTSQMIKVQTAPGDSSRYYTVEFRTKSGDDAGIDNDIMLIHEVRDGTPYLIRNLAVADRAPAQTVTVGDLQISPGARSGVGIRVNVTIGQKRGATREPNACKTDFRARKADASDLVCVSQAAYLTVLNENATASQRWADPTTKACVSGYVWREAFPQDKVCVTAARRTETTQQNRDARNNVLYPGG